MITRNLGIALMLAVALAGNASAGDSSKLRVNVEGVIVQADYNTDWVSSDDAELREQIADNIEGSVTFLVNAPFKKVLANMLNPGTLGKISPNIHSYTARRVGEDEKYIRYKVEEELSPFKMPILGAMAKSKVHLDMTIHKTQIPKGRIVVDYALDPNEENDWKKFSGSIYAVDLHNGKTMIMVATSTQSNYTILRGLRLKLAKHFLAKTKDNIVSWLGGL